MTRESIEVTQKPVQRDSFDVTEDAETIAQEANTVEVPGFNRTVARSRRAGVLVLSAIGLVISMVAITSNAMPNSLAATDATHSSAPLGQLVLPHTDKTNFRAVLKLQEVVKAAWKNLDPNDSALHQAVINSAFFDTLSVWECITAYDPTHPSKTPQQCIDDAAYPMYAKMEGVINQKFTDSCRKFVELAKGFCHEPAVYRDPSTGEVVSERTEGVEIELPAYTKLDGLCAAGLLTEGVPGGPHRTP